jgi:hypothetical protein
MVLRVLWMFRAFGILKSKRVGRGICYFLDERCPFAGELRGVLAALDGAMPQWRVIGERDVISPRVRPYESRRGHRKNKRWKW